jgi:hypothetical protein
MGYAAGIGLVSLFFAFIFASLAEEVGRKRGMSRFNSFMFGLFFGPLGLVCTLLWPGGLAYDTQCSGKALVCTICQSMVDAAATKCRHCQTVFS